MFSCSGFRPVFCVYIAYNKLDFSNSEGYDSLYLEVENIAVADDDTPAEIEAEVRDGHKSKHL